MQTGFDDVNQIFNWTLQMKLEEFTQLAKNVVDLLRKEESRLGTFYITGKMVEMKPHGQATVVGDLHGDLETLNQILQDSQFTEKMKQEKQQPLLIFLGDYGDRGINSAEVYGVVLKLKKTYPEHVILMRGNHEGPEDLTPSPHDLPTYLQRKFGENWRSAYEKLRLLFDELYTGVIVNERYVLLHGGVPSQAKTKTDIAFAHKKHPREPHLEEILWNDPEEAMTGTSSSPRGAGKLFGKDVTDKFLQMLNVNLLIRGHEPSEAGYKVNHEGKVLTLFSRKGEPYFNSSAAYLQLDLSRKVENAHQLQDSIKLL